MTVAAETSVDMGPGSFSHVCPVKSVVCHLPHTCMLTLSTGFEWPVPGFPTVKSVFTFTFNQYPGWGDTETVYPLVFLKFLSIFFFFASIG